MLAFISKLILRYHRWLGVMAALPLILWGLSGLSHPIMTRVQPQPAAMSPPSSLMQPSTAQERSTLPSLAVLLKNSGITQISSARLMHWQGRLLWQINLGSAHERIYINANTGEALPDTDRAIAIALARHYSGEKNAAVTSAQLITQFTPEYLYVNRLLPVWRIEFNRADNLRAYIETHPARLATLDNNTKTFFGKIFRNLHSWAFISNELLRDTLMTLFLSVAFFSSVGGLWLYGFFWRKPVNGARAKPTRIWHRRLGIVVAVSTLTFSASAILHLQLLQKSSNAGSAAVSAQRIAVQTLQAPPSVLPTSAHSAVSILPFENGAAWNVSAPTFSAVGKHARQGMPHAHHEHSASTKKTPQNSRYFSLETGTEIHQGEQRQARWLAAQASGVSAHDILSVSRVEKFASEYGFINKRLPVQRVAVNTPDHRTLFIETSTGITASEITDTQRFEGASFAYLHKAVWLDGAGKNIRDALLGLFALLNAVVAALGVALFLRRKK